MKRGNSHHYNLRKKRKKRECFVPENSDYDSDEDESYVESESIDSDIDSEDYDDIEESEDEGYDFEELAQKIRENVKRRLEDLDESEYTFENIEDVCIKEDLNSRDTKKAIDIANAYQASEPALRDIINSDLPFEAKQLWVKKYFDYKNDPEGCVEIRYEINNMLKYCDRPNVWDDPIKSFHKSITVLQTTEKNKNLLYNRLYDYIGGGDENVKYLLKEALTLPYSKKSHSNVTLKDRLSHIRYYLDTKLHKMDKVKQELLLLANKCMLSGKGGAILLVGDYGIGKTTIAKAFAESLGVEYGYLSLAGMTTAEVLTGSPAVHVRSSPGRITQELKRMGTCDGVMVIDEIDKVRGHYSDNIYSSLFPILDPDHNTCFEDHHLPGIDIDLSNIIFVCTANDISRVPPGILNRVDVIEVEGYKNNKDKSTIVEKYKLPGLMKIFDLDNFKMDSSAWNYIFLHVKEKGIREVHRIVSKLVNIVSIKISLQELPEDFIVDRQFVEKCNIVTKQEPPLGMYN